MRLPTLAAAWFAVGLGLATPAKARCTNGDVHAILQSFETFLAQGDRGSHTRMLWQSVGGDVQFAGPCQYRLWAGPSFADLRDGAEPRVFPFKAGQLFLGASVYYWDYQRLGMPRPLAVADIKLASMEQRLIPADASFRVGEAALRDPAYVRTLQMTAFRDVMTPEGANVVQQSGFVAQLPAGNYVSVFRVSYPGNPDLAELVPDAAEWLTPYELESVVYLRVEP